MRIGGKNHDSLMTFIPLAVAIVLVTVYLGGPEEALRGLERLASDAWVATRAWFRR